MTPSMESLALALLLTAPTAAIAMALGVLVDRLTADPRLRARLWSLALTAPLIPPGLLILTAGLPDSVGALPPPVGMEPQSVIGPIVAAGPVTHSFDPGVAATALLGLAAAMTGMRLIQLILRACRLRVLLRTARPAPADWRRAWVDACDALGVRASAVVLSDRVREPLLSGGWRPALVLPAGWVEAAPDGAPAVLAHEAAHLKRRDHLSLWFDEAVLTLLAANPLMPLIRDRLSAAREEACDALALAGRSAAERRAFARAYLDALQTGPTPLPALSLAGEPRRLAMRRLTSILATAAPGSMSARLATGVSAVLLLAVGASAAWAASTQDPPSSAPPSLEEAERVARAYMGDAAYDAQTRAFETADGVDFQRFCASGEAGEDGFCAGVIIGVMVREAERSEPRFCAPAPEPEAVRLAVRWVAAQEATPADTPRAVAERALAGAFPCDPDVTAADRSRVFRHDQFLVNGSSLPPIPLGYGPVQVTGSEVVYNDDGSVDWRSPGGRPVTRLAIDGRLQAEGFDMRTIDPATIDHLRVDADHEYIDIVLRRAD